MIKHVCRIVLCGPWQRRCKFIRVVKALLKVNEHLLKMDKEGTQIDSRGYLGANATHKYDLRVTELIYSALGNLPSLASES